MIRTGNAPKIEASGGLQIDRRINYKVGPFSLVVQICCAQSTVKKMSDPQNQSQKAAPIGELFARLYVERGAPVQDSSFFRNRLDAYLQANHYKDYAEISTYLKQEAGLIVATAYLEKYSSVFFNFSDFFSKTRIEFVLNAITLIWRYLVSKYPEWVKSGEPASPYGYAYPMAQAWRTFVSRVMREENMAYTLDEKCGVHFVVDEEFERNRVSVLKCLEAPRYAGVRAAFEGAHHYLDAQPTDTKGSVRSAFEALEILARLMDPQSKNLNKWMVQNKLKPLAIATAVEDTEANTIEMIFDGLAHLVDGLHNYRHGQAVEQPVAPSLTVAVYVTSSVAAALRWMVAIDERYQQAGDS